MLNPLCTFCEIIQGNAPASVVYADDQVMAFVDIQPVNVGHLLVVPKAHVADLAGLAPDVGGRLFRTGMRLAAALRKADLRCDGVNLLLADGEVAGQEVFHIHLHVIPRFLGDGFGFRFDPDYFRLPDRPSLDTVAAEVRRALEDR